MNNVLMVFSLLSSILPINESYIHENSYFGEKEFYETVSTNHDSSYFQTVGEFYRIGYSQYVVNPTYSFNQYFTTIIKIPLINVSEDSIVSSTMQLYKKSGNISCVNVHYTFDNIDYSATSLPSLTHHGYTYLSNDILTINTKSIVEDALSNSKNMVSLVLSMSMTGGYGEFYKLSSSNQYAPVFTLETTDCPINTVSYGDYYEIESNSTTSTSSLILLNCASYALRKYDSIYDDLIGEYDVPYQYSKESFLNDILSYTLNGFINDCNKTLRLIDDYDSLLFEHEWRIACCLKVQNNRIEDLHFMIQTNGGKWAEKRREQPSSIYDVENPNTINWGEYYQDIVYFAVSWGL